MFIILTLIYTACVCCDIHCSLFIQLSAGTDSNCQILDFICICCVSIFNLLHIQTHLGACIYCNIDCSLSVSIKEYDDDDDDEIN